MAIIRKIIKSNSYTMKNKLTYCEAEYNDYTFDDEKFVRIQTFGSDVRKEKGKQSQVIHLNKETAKQLIEYLNDSFDLKLNINF